jgi:hypothetical protein
MLLGMVLLFFDDGEDEEEEEEDDEEEEDEEDEKVEDEKEEDEEEDVLEGEQANDAATSPLIVLSLFLDDAATPSIRVTEENNDEDLETNGLGMSITPTSALSNTEFE